MKIVLIGCGNPSRGDDGLGLKLAEAVEEREFPDVTVDADYQLNIEHAVDISEADIVIFTDASVDGYEPFEFLQLEPSNRITFTSHSVDAGSVLTICKDIYHRTPEAWILGIRGYSFEPVEEISTVAKDNLEKASKFLLSWIGNQCSR